MKRFLKFFVGSVLTLFLFSGLFGIFLSNRGFENYLTPKSAEAAITRVQFQTCNNSGATTISCTLSSTPVNGNVLIAVIGTRGTTANRVTSITQTGVTWTKAVESVNASADTTDIWYTNGASSASTSVTINLASSLKASAIVAEYSDLATSSVLDVTATSTGNSGTASTGTTATTAQADELWVGGLTAPSSGYSFSAPTNSFTEVAESGSGTGGPTTRNKSVYLERIVSATGTASTAETVSTSSQWSGAVATFKRNINVTVGVTAGSMTADVDSGATSQLANSSSCTSVATCSAFTLVLNGGSTTLTSFKVTQTGTASSADLSNLALFYDTDGNYNNGTTGQFGTTVTSFTGNTATVAGSLAISSGSTYYFYVRYDVKSTSPTYPRGGQTVAFQVANNADVVTGFTTVGAPVSLAGGSAVHPNATGTTFGSGLGDGGRGTESIVISGFGFGVAPGGSRASCTGAVNTGCVKFIVGGTATVADADVTAWSNTYITFTINSGLVSDGGALALEVSSGNKTDTTPLTFYIYPTISGMTTCSSGVGRDNACGTNAAMEYSGSDTFGLIQLNGDHFKASGGTVTFTGAFGSVVGTVHGVVEGACSVAGWSSTSVCVEVSSSISDTVNSGTVTLTRNGDNKTDVISLQVLPRILTNTASSDVVGNVVVIDGNHFCQTGACPSTPPSSDYLVYFGSTQAVPSDFVATGSCSGQGASWSNTKICVKVPTGTPSGSADTKVVGQASPLYESQRKTFSVASTGPNVPDVGPGTNKGQYKSDAMTVISIGGATNQSTVVFKADISASSSINMALQIEVQPVGTAFTCIAGACGAAVEGTIGGGGACNSCASLAGARVDVIGITDGSKHWQARVRNTTTNEYSAWVSFGGNAESAADFIVDTVAPTITFSGSDTCNDAVSGLSANGVTLSWTLNENATGQVEYSIDSGLSGSASYPIPVNPSASSHAISLSNLNSNTTYYFKLKSQDAATNLTQRPSIAPFCSFTTTAVTQPGKTVSFHVAGETGVITNNSGSGSSYYFSVFIPEAAYSIKSSYVEITGYSLGGGTNSVEVQVNSQQKKAFIIDATSPTHFRVLYPIDAVTLNINDDLPCTDGNPSGTPPCNKLMIVPSVGQDINIGSAEIITTYGFTP